MKEELANRGEELTNVKVERNDLLAKLEEMTQEKLSQLEIAEVHKQVTRCHLPRKAGTQKIYKSRKFGYQSIEISLTCKRLSGIRLC